MSRVIIIQRNLMWDAGRQNLVDKFDFSPAREYGELHFLLSHSLSPFNAQAAIKVIWEALQDINFSEDDYLLLSGNPCLIAWTAAMVADMTGGKIKLLQWSGKDRRYIRIDSEIWDDDDK